MTTWKSRRAPLCWAKWCSLVVGVAMAAGTAAAANAEVSEVRLAFQYGIPYLPFIVMKKDNLIEKQVAREGLGTIKVTWARFGSGAAMNDALLSGALDFATGGVAPLLKIWDKSKGGIDVKGVASLGSMPMYLNTTNPNVKSIKDFGDDDKIALPAIKVSIQALVLEMAAAKQFGAEDFAHMDRDTVSMKHPDAMVAMLSHAGITAHFGNPPFQDMELEHPGVHRVLSSYDVIGEPSTLDVVYATSKFHDDNPKVYRAVLMALREAMDIINKDKKAAAELYVTETKTKLTNDFVNRILANPDFIFTTTPRGVMKYAKFMHKVGAIQSMPSSWKDVFFPAIAGEPGS